MTVKNARRRQHHENTEHCRRNSEAKRKKPFVFHMFSILIDFYGFMLYSIGVPRECVHIGIHSITKTYKGKAWHINR